MRILFIMTAAICIVAGAEGRTETTLDWMQQAYADGQHNAFTDLIRWKDQYYLGFRHAQSHMSMDGEIRVMRCADMKNWQPCGTLDTWGDDRDPHFVATDGTLYVFFGTWDLAHALGHGTPDRHCVRSCFATTSDGEHWSKVQGVYESGWWLWRVRAYKGALYSAAYTACRPKPAERETRLLRSDDGLNWTCVSTVTQERMAGEADLLFRPDGALWLLSRTGDRPGDAMWLRSNPALTQWERKDTGVLVHSPVFLEHKDWLFIAGRGKDGDHYVTRVWESIDGQLKALITLPSGGDTSYPGLILDPATAESDHPALFVSWYSQHERDQKPGASRDAAAVYVGRIVVDPR